MFIPTAAVSFYYSELEFSGGWYHYLIRAVKKPEMAVTTLFAFFATICDGPTTW